MRGGEGGPDATTCGLHDRCRDRSRTLRHHELAERASRTRRRANSLIATASGGRARAEESTAWTPAKRLRFLRKKYSWMLVCGGTKVLKRLLDVVVALVLVVLLAPLLALVALLIKLTDGGPILFWQTRIACCLISNPRSN